MGRALIRYLLEQAEDAGMVEAFLEVRPSNAIAMVLYQSLGSNRSVTRRGYYQAVGGREDAAVLKLAPEGVRRPLRRGHDAHSGRADRAADFSSKNNRRPGRAHDAYWRSRQAGTRPF